MKTVVFAVFAACVAFGVAGCSSNEAGGDAEVANQEIIKQNPSNIPTVSEEQASGDATAVAGPKKGGGG
jgi:hypothetical protein